MINLQTIPIPRADVIGQRMEDEAVVVTAAAGMVTVLNDVGARIWELADGQHSVAQIAEILCVEYAVAPEQAQSDALAFVADLADRGILSVAG